MRKVQSSMNEPGRNRKYNRPITSLKLKMILKTSANQSRGQDSFTGEFYQTFREELTQFLLKQLQKRWEGRNTFQLFLWAYPHLHTKTENIIKKENDRPITLMNIDAKVLNKILAIWIQQYIKRVIHYDQMGFISRIQGFVNIHKSNSVIHHLNK